MTNKIKPMRVLLLLLLMPIIVPFYLLGIVFSIAYVSVYCGFKNNEKYFMDGLGHETTEQIVERLIKDNKL